MRGKARVVCVHPRLPVCACSDGEKVALWEFQSERHADRPAAHNAAMGVASDEPVHALDFLDYETLTHAGYGSDALRSPEMQTDDVAGARQPESAGAKFESGDQADEAAGAAMARGGSGTSMSMTGHETSSPCVRVDGGRLEEQKRSDLKSE